MTEEYNKQIEDKLFKGLLVSRYFGRDKKGHIIPSIFYPERVSSDLQKTKPIVTMRDSLAIYVYDQKLGCYQSNGKQRLRELINKILRAYYREHRAKEVINKITTETAKDRTELNPALYLNIFTNGILDISKNLYQLLPHSPKHFFTSVLPVEYKPDAKCPKFLKFLEQVLPSKMERLRLQEHVGKTLYRKNIFEKGVLIIGPEDSGKSTFLKVLERLLGDGNFTAVPLQELIIDPFASAQLYHKYAVICADIPKITLRYSGKIKMIISGDTLSGQFKYHDRFDFPPYAKIWVSANEPPPTVDKSNAFFKRWDIFEFPNQFQGENCNPFIINEITTPEELSGILNWALEGLQRLLKNKRFTNMKSIKDRREIWLLGSSSLYKFVKKCVEESDLFEPYEDFYAEYASFCKIFNLPILDKKVVTRELPRILPGVRLYYPKIGDRQVKCWKGVKVTKVKELALPDI